MSKEPVFCYKVTSTNRQGALIFLDFKNIEPFLGGQRDSSSVTIEKIEIKDIDSRDIHTERYSEKKRIVESILKWLTERNVTKFTQRELHYRFKSKFNRVEKLYPYINILKKCLYINEIKFKKPAYRPSRHFEVNLFLVKDHLRSQDANRMDRYSKAIKELLSNEI